MIYIGKPHIQHTTEHTVRLACNVDIDGDSNDFFIECDRSYEQYLLTERSDAFLWLMLPVAMQKHHDIICEIPVTEMLLHNINMFLVPARIKGDPILSSPQIICKTERETIGGKEVGTALSLGVDTMFTLQNYLNSHYESMNISIFYMGNISPDLLAAKCQNLTEYLEKNKKLFSRYESVAAELGRPFLKTFSNFYELGFRKNRMEHNWNHNFFIFAEILCFRKLFRGYLFSSGYDFSHFSLENNSRHDTAYYDLLLTNCLTLPDFFCISAGGAFDRIDKTKSLFDYDLARRELHPCFSLSGNNCSKPTCAKCLRALLTADYYDRLDALTIVFDVESYTKNRSEYFIELCKHKDNAFMIQLYAWFCEKEPDEMKRAQQQLERRTAPIARPIYDEVMGWYHFSLRLLSLDNPADLIAAFFKERSANNLFVIGSSNMGQTIRNLIKGKTGICFVEDPNNADCILCAATTAREIRQITENAKSQHSKLPVYTLENIRRFVLSKK